MKKTHFADYRCSMIGLITLNSLTQYNFGCLLQNYALLTYLNKSGVPAETVFCASFSALGACRTWVHNFLHVDFQKTSNTFCLVAKEEKNKNRECSKFVKKVLCPRSYKVYNKFTYCDIAKRYDKVIVGSDQVWNPDWAINDKTATTYFLSFIEPERRISYAASFGVEKIPKEKQNKYETALREFNKISVREDAGKRIVEELTGRTDVQVLVDPTMLLTTQEWDEVAEKPKKQLPEKYLLTYFLGTVSKERRQAVEKRAAELGCETIWLMDKDSPFYAIGPGHFVYMIKHAQMVCTDSFHGSVFSFLYGKPLAIFDREGSAENMGSRIRTLADKFRLEDCLVKNNIIPDVIEADYSAGYTALEAERKKSKAFLDMVFQEAERAGLCK